ncbi:hypothetical protein ACQKJC_18915 [Priestia koreensis]|uniref:hypothetical protein n=1 Tax=Priestia koreensis TaxID=284581 RepID=UPI0020410F33|nr:hypothetical protein [Priestia koreensis]MCM3005613.1 hypothetical protein [Priestia koreensis]
MKKQTIFIYPSIALLSFSLLMTGCSDDEAATGNSTKVVENSEKNPSEEQRNSSEHNVDSTKPEQKDTSSENQENLKEKTDPLSAYSSKKIEYARVWLQLGLNQQIDHLYIQHIKAGTKLNPDDETSGSYPEDVIQLAGSRLVDGSVTYSGNGNGTINVYNVPLRWDGQYPAGEDFYKDIIKHTTLVSVDVGDDEQVIQLIKKIEKN